MSVLDHNLTLKGIIRMITSELLRNTFDNSQKALNIQVHNPVPVVESSPSPAWEPEDPFNELANRPKEKFVIMTSSLRNNNSTFI